MITSRMEETVAGLPESTGKVEAHKSLGANVSISRCPEGRIQIILSDAPPPPGLSACGGLGSSQGSYSSPR